MKYLKTEHAEESLEFLLAVITYHKLASPYYPNPLPLAAKDTVTSATAGTPSITTPLETPSSVVPPVLAEPPEYITPPVPSPDVAKRIQDMFTVIVEDFITPGGQREINIIERHRKFILTEFKNGNYHPEIWKSTFEHIANLLRANSLIKFLKLSGVSISGQHSSYVSPTNTSLESTSPTKNSPATGRSISMKKK
ncbi:hypothetical protein BC833DRAFT_576803 [Globomyces pollinis-pini]|nr:hypothetical protein BC833DRAFT_576803 [Globomyces pollinis-pini]